MRLPLVALIGRPNVGKSTLFNRLVGERLAIVEDIPGVTRDRLYADAEWFGRSFSVVDTGGYEPRSEDPLFLAIREQAALALQEADLVCLVVDARAGLVPGDMEIAQLLRRAGQPVVLAVNKVEGPRQELDAAEFHALAIDDMYPVSAAHGRGMTDLVDRFLELLPPQVDEPEEERTVSELLPEDEGAPREIRVSFIGKPNVGKSTLVNRLLGEERSLVSDIPGTTRDPVDSELSLDGRHYRLIDTAGLRRKSKIRLDLERYTVTRSLRAIDRSHVVCFLLDVREGVSDQDQRIAAYAQKRGRASVVLLNKWDLLEEKSSRMLDAMLRQLREDFAFLPHAPVLAISAQTGRGVHKVLELVDLVREQHRTRIPTGPLNRVFQEIVEAHHPPLFKGHMVKLYYITQKSVAPPTFMISCNHPEGVGEPYRRYIENRLRQAFPFTGTPLRFDIAKRGATPPGGAGEAAGPRRRTSAAGGRRKKR